MVFSRAKRDHHHHHHHHHHRNHHYNHHHYGPRTKTTTSISTSFTSSYLLFLLAILLQLAPVTRTDLAFPSLSSSSSPDAPTPLHHSVGRRKHTSSLPLSPPPPHITDTTVEYRREMPLVVKDSLVEDIGTRRDDPLSTQPSKHSTQKESRLRQHTPIIQSRKRHPLNIQPRKYSTHRESRLRQHIPNIQPRKPSIYRKVSQRWSTQTPGTSRHRSHRRVVRTKEDKMRNLEARRDFKRVAERDNHTYLVQIPGMENAIRWENISHHSSLPARVTVYHEEKRLPDKQILPTEYSSRGDKRTPQNSLLQFSAKENEPPRELKRTSPSNFIQVQGTENVSVGGRRRDTWQVSESSSSRAATRGWMKVGMEEEKMEIEKLEKVILAEERLEERELREEGQEEEKMTEEILKARLEKKREMENVKRLEEEGEMEEEQMEREEGGEEMEGEGKEGKRLEKVEEMEREEQEDMEVAEEDKEGTRQAGRDARSKSDKSLLESTTPTLERITGDEQEHSQKYVVYAREERVRGRENDVVGRENDVVRREKRMRGRENSVSGLGYVVRGRKNSFRAWKNVMLTREMTENEAKAKVKMKSTKEKYINSVNLNETNKRVSERNENVVKARTDSVNPRESGENIVIIKSRSENVRNMRTNTESDTEKDVYMNEDEMFATKSGSGKKIVETLPNELQIETRPTDNVEMQTEAPGQNEMLIEIHDHTEKQAEIHDTVEMPVDANKPVELRAKKKENQINIKIPIKMRAKINENVININSVSDARTNSPTHISSRRTPAAPSIEHNNTSTRSSLRRPRYNGLQIGQFFLGSDTSHKVTITVEGPQPKPPGASPTPPPITNQSEVPSPITIHSEASLPIRDHSEIIPTIRNHSETPPPIRKNSETHPPIKKHSAIPPPIRDHSESSSLIVNHSEAPPPITSYDLPVWWDISTQPSPFGSTSSSRHLKAANMWFLKSYINMASNSEEQTDISSNSVRYASSAPFSTIHNKKIVLSSSNSNNVLSNSNNNGAIIPLYMQDPHLISFKNANAAIRGKVDELKIGKQTFPESDKTHGPIKTSNTNSVDEEEEGNPMTRAEREVVSDVKRDEVSIVTEDKSTATLIGWLQKRAPLESTVMVAGGNDVSSTPNSFPPFPPLFLSSQKMVALLSCQPHRLRMQVVSKHRDAEYRAVHRRPSTTENLTDNDGGGIDVDKSDGELALFGLLLTPRTLHQQRPSVVQEKSCWYRTKVFPSFRMSPAMENLGNNYENVNKPQKESTPFDLSQSPSPQPNKAQRLNSKLMPCYDASGSKDEDIDDSDERRRMTRSTPALPRSMIRGGMKDKRRRRTTRHTPTLTSSTARRERSTRNGGHRGHIAGNRIRIGRVRSHTRSRASESRGKVGQSRVHRWRLRRHAKHSVLSATERKRSEEGETQNTLVATELKRGEEGEVQIPPIAIEHRRSQGDLQHPLVSSRRQFQVDGRSAKGSTLNFPTEHQEGYDGWAIETESRNPRETSRGKGHSGDPASRKVKHMYRNGQQGNQPGDVEGGSQNSTISLSTKNETPRKGFQADDSKTRKTALKYINKQQEQKVKREKLPIRKPDYDVILDYNHTLEETNNYNSVLNESVVNNTQRQALKNGSEQKLITSGETIAAENNNGHAGIVNGRNYSKNIQMSELGLTNNGNYSSFPVQTSIPLGPLAENKRGNNLSTTGRDGVSQDVDSPHNTLLHSGSRISSSQSSPPLTTGSKNEVESSSTYEDKTIHTFFNNIQNYLYNLRQSQAQVDGKTWQSYNPADPGTYNFTGIMASSDTPSQGHVNLSSHNAHGWRENGQHKLGDWSDNRVNQRPSLSHGMKPSDMQGSKSFINTHNRTSGTQDNPSHYIENQRVGTPMHFTSEVPEVDLDPPKDSTRSQLYTREEVSFTHPVFSEIQTSSSRTKARNELYPDLDIPLPSSSTHRTTIEVQTSPSRGNTRNENLIKKSVITPIVPSLVPVLNTTKGSQTEVNEDDSSTEGLQTRTRYSTPTRRDLLPWTHSPPTRSPSHPKSPPISHQTTPTAINNNSHPSTSHYHQSPPSHQVTTVMSTTTNNKNNKYYSNNNNNSVASHMYQSPVSHQATPTNKSLKNNNPVASYYQQSPPNHYVNNNNNNNTPATLDTKPVAPDLFVPILGLFDLTVRGEARQGGRSEFAAAQLALKHINEKRVIPGHTLVMFHNDTKCDSGRGVDAFFHAIYTSRAKMMILLGAACPEVTESLAAVVHYWNIVQVSFGSVSPALSDRSSFPRFIRTVAPDSSHNAARLAFLTHHSWSTVTTISENHDMYTLALNELMPALEAANITLQATVTLSPGDYTEHLHSLKNQDCRIFIASFSTELARKVFCQ
ncbi:hypothetical protein Pcinc_039275, partial [Petrolisthes cinctipes]